VVGRIGGDGDGVGGDPVGDRLVNDTKQPPDGAQAHPFEVELDCLCMDGGTVSLLFRGGGEVAPAGEAAVALGAGTVVSPLADGGR
jgi:hypothetical protein